MEVTLWGTRGTFPVPGPSTVRYGGDTTCLSIETEAGVLVIDTGTGVRALGQALANDGRNVAIVYTHIHADHVMGFPFFAPLYDGERTVYVIDHRLGEREWSATQLLDGAHFPLTPSQLPCALHRVSKDPQEFLAEFGFTVRRTLLNHPGGAYGYRIEHNGKSLVFIPDNELLPRAHPVVTFDQVAEFCAGADVLVHDAQYTEQEFEERGGWGHSTYSQACDLAVAAEVKSLLLTHHDPMRTDDELDALQEQVQQRMGGSGVVVAMATDGMRLDLL